MESDVSDNQSENEVASATLLTPNRTNTNPGCEDCGFWSPNRGERRDHRALECQMFATVHYKNGPSVLHRRKNHNFHCPKCSFVHRDARKINMHSKKCDAEQASGATKELEAELNKAVSNVGISKDAPATITPSHRSRTSLRKSSSRRHISATTRDIPRHKPSPGSTASAAINPYIKSNISNSKFAVPPDSNPLPNPWLTKPMPKSFLYPEIASTLEEFQKRASSVKYDIWPYPIRTMGQSNAVVLLDYRKHIGYGPPPSDLRADIGDIFIDYATPRYPLVYFFTPTQTGGKWEAFNEQSVITGDDKTWIEVLRHPLFLRTYLWANDEKGIYWVGETRVNESSWSEANPMRVRDKSRSPFICDYIKVFGEGVLRDCQQLVHNPSTERRKQAEIERRKSVKVDPPTSIRFTTPPSSSNPSGSSTIPKRSKKTALADNTPGPNREEIKALFSSSASCFDEERLLLNEDGVRVHSSSPNSRPTALQLDRPLLSDTPAQNTKRKEPLGFTQYESERPLKQKKTGIPSPLASEIANGIKPIQQTISDMPDSAFSPRSIDYEYKIMNDEQGQVKVGIPVMSRELQRQFMIDTSTFHSITDLLLELGKEFDVRKRKDEEYVEMQVELNRLREEIVEERTAKSKADSRLKATERELAQQRIKSTRAIEELEKRLREHS